MRKGVSAAGPLYPAICGGLMELVSLIRAIKEENPDWSFGENLTAIALTTTQQDELATTLGELFPTAMRLAHAERKRWGALVFLFGAKVFGSVEDEAFRWETIGEHLSIANLYGLINISVYDAIDEGIEEIWGIDLLRTGQGDRSFVGSMIYHSGGGWRVLADLVGRVPGTWNWLALAELSLSEVVTWIEGERTKLLALHQKALRHGDTQVAMAERLIQMAQTRQYIQLRGWCMSDLPATLAAIAGSGSSARSILEAPSDEAAAQVLDSMFGFSDADKQRSAAPRTTLRWCWRSGPVPGLGLQVPQRLTGAVVPTHADRAQLVVVDAPEQARPPLYVRNPESGELDHDRGASVLAVPGALAAPVEVMVRYREGETFGERTFASLDWPQSPVAIFDFDSGRQRSSAPAGTRVVLVAEPPWRITCPAGFERQQSATDCAAYAGAMPTVPVRCTLQDESETLEWELAPAGQQVSVLADGPRHEGVRLGRALVFRRWPTLFVDVPDARGQLRVDGPNGLVKEGSFRTRAGRLRIPAPAAPGLYRVRVTASDGRSSTVPFVVLPDVTFGVRASQGGTLLSVVGASARLHVVDGVYPSQTELLLPAEQRGQIRIAVRLALHDEIDLEWIVTAAPPRARVFETRDRPASADTTDLTLISDTGGVLVEGAPETQVTIALGEHEWMLTFPRTGERFFPFARIPAWLLRTEQRQTLDIKWSGASAPTKLGPFWDESAARPDLTVKREHGLFSVRIRTLRAHEGLSLEAVRVWQPWTPAYRAMASPVETTEKGIWFEAPLSVANGPYIVALTNDDRRVSGMRLVMVGEDDSYLPAPDDATEFEKTLWGLPPKDPTVDPRPRYPTDDEAYANLRVAAAGRDGAKLLSGLAATLLRYGHRWFHIHKVLPECASAERLRQLLELGEEDDEPSLLRLYDAMDIPFVMTRYADVKAIAFSPEQAGRWMQKLDEEEAGLAVCAHFEWNVDIGSLDDRQRRTYMPALARWGQLAERPVSNRDSDVIELVRMPRELGPRELRARGPRVEMLLEARLAANKMWTKQRLRDIVETRGAISDPPDTEFGRLPARIPPRVRAIDATLARFTHVIHLWRAGTHRMSGDFWRQIRLLWKHVPHGVDTWLNYWATQHYQERR